MSSDARLSNSRFPRAAAYHPEWILAGGSGGANPLWLTEWLSEELDLRPGMRVLDLGCGRALSSIFLHREFGVQVWAADLWFSAKENMQRVRDAGVQDAVFPLQADARTLPFGDEFFDAVVSIDAFMYFGTDDWYLNYLARFVRPGGQIGIALAGFLTELDAAVPEHLSSWWTAENPYCMHSAAWWQHHWERTGIVDVSIADSLPDGWQFWRDWLAQAAPGNTMELETLETDAGRNLGYVRAVGRRRSDVELFPAVVNIPEDYTQRPMLRNV
ncbi:MAG: class I SAM-dependent methyltransferase [Planctomycetaceae bacterium]|nr:class I SAM-dependent methyltransferase [Planctomycetaceae bacterium]